MKENKNIDRLFQEKFKDFEVAPPELAWKNIEKKLNKKENKRRVIPYWLKASGIAASLLLGFYISINNSATNIESKIKTVEKESNSDTKNDNDTNLKSNKKPDFISTPNATIVTGNEKINASAFSEINSVKVKKNIDFQNEKVVNSNRKSKTTVLNKASTTSDLVDSDKKIKVDVLSNTGSLNNLEKNLPSKKSSFELDNTERLANNTINQIKNNSNRFVSIPEKSNSIKTQDSSIVAKISEEVYALEQLLKEKEVGKNVEEKEKVNKWGVSSVAAPVYFNSTTNSSSIDVQFADNSKSYLSTLSYGIGLSYNVSKKMSLRAGVNSLTLEYNTNDVSYTTSLKQAPQAQTAISRNSNGENIIFSNSSMNNSLSGDLENFTQNTKGVLNQSTSYFEIPLEMSYKLIDKKFGLELIGGMSSLFLNNNSVSLLANGMEMKIGQANNLNKIHFSSNVGVSFNYLFFKSFEVNFNPMLKYQLNTYSENSGNFKPYFIGLYSGLAYKF